MPNASPDRTPHTSGSDCATVSSAPDEGAVGRLTHPDQTRGDHALVAPPLQSEVSGRRSRRCGRVTMGGAESDGSRLKSSAAPGRRTQGRGSRRAEARPDELWPPSPALKIAAQPKLRRRTSVDRGIAHGRRSAGSHGGGDPRRSGGARSSALKRLPGYPDSADRATRMSRRKRISPGPRLRIPQMAFGGPHSTSLL